MDYIKNTYSASHALLERQDEKSLEITITEAIKESEEKDLIKLKAHVSALDIISERTIYSFIKRVLDIIVCSTAAVLLFPLFVIIAFCIKLDSKGPVIYKQTRVGKNGKIFQIYKFRSMYHEADREKNKWKDMNQMDGPVFKISGDPRITKIGQLLRSTSLDEFPQIFNILKGDMTIVGPRPALIKEVLEFTPEHLKRLTVKQGLTCYWQIGGRSDLTFAEWVQLDKKYIENRTLFVDFKIILLTIPVVLQRKGAY